jgi:hypothetical protein
LEQLHGYQLHVVWGHELKDQLRRNPQMRQLWDGQIADEVVGPLDPREDALRGGRTEPFALHHVCAPDEEIVCIDIVSVPSICRHFYNFLLHTIGELVSICNEVNGVSHGQSGGADSGDHSTATSNPMAAPRAESLQRANQMPSVATNTHQKAAASIPHQ